MNIIRRLVNRILAKVFDKKPIDFSTARKIMTDFAYQLGKQTGEKDVSLVIDSNDLREQLELDYQKHFAYNVEQLVYIWQTEWEKLPYFKYKNIIENKIKKIGVLDYKMQRDIFFIAMDAFWKGFVQGLLKRNINIYKLADEVLKTYRKQLSFIKNFMIGGRNMLNRKGGAPATVTIKAKNFYIDDINIVIEGAFKDGFDGLRVVKSEIPVSDFDISLESYYQGTPVLEGKDLVNVYFKVLLENMKNEEPDLFNLIEDFIKEEWIDQQIERIEKRYKRRLTQDEENFYKTMLIEDVKQDGKIRLVADSIDIDEISDRIGVGYSLPRIKVGDIVLEDTVKYVSMFPYLVIRNKKFELDLQFDFRDAISIVFKAKPLFVEIWDNIFLGELSEFTREDLIELIKDLGYTDIYDINNPEDLERARDELEDEIMKEIQWRYETFFETIK